MTVVLSLALAAGLCAQQVSTAPGRAITLDEAYALTLERSEALAMSREDYAEASARLRELRGAMLPQVSGRASRSWQDIPNAGQSFRPTPHVTVVQMSGSQTLFSGFREFIAFRAAGKQKEARDSDSARLRGLLYQDVVAAYTDLLGALQSVETLRATRALTADRLEELRRRVRIGKSRESEVLAADSQLASLEADIERAVGAVDDAEEALKFLTGLDEDLRPAPVEAPIAGTLESFLNRAQSRPDVRSRALESEAAEALSRVQAREAWPLVGASGNYYPYRKGSLEGMRWDGQLFLQVPLFAGGSLAARRGQAEARAREAALQERLARRAATREVRAAYKSLGAALARLKRLERASQLAEANAKAQTEDYRLGLVTNLEVLAGLTSFSQARLARDQARLDAVAARARLEVASGGPAAPAGAQP